MIDPTTPPNRRETFNMSKVEDRDMKSEEMRAYHKKYNE